MSDNYYLIKVKKKYYARILKYLIANCIEGINNASIIPYGSYIIVPITTTDIAEIKNNIDVPCQIEVVSEEYNKRSDVNGK